MIFSQKENKSKCYINAAPRMQVADGAHCVHFVLFFDYWVLGAGPGRYALSIVAFFVRTLARSWLSNFAALKLLRIWILDYL